MNKNKINDKYKNDQLAWLETNLKNCNKKWKIVCGHYPLYSCGDHGNTNDLIQLIEPLFKKYGVDLYICGHDHSFQHIKKDKVNYIVTGCVSKIGSINLNVPIKQYMLNNFVKPGFTSLLIDANVLTIDYIDTNAKSIYKYYINK